MRYQSRGDKEQAGDDSQREEGHNAAEQRDDDGAVALGGVLAHADQAHGAQYGSQGQDGAQDEEGGEGEGRSCQGTGVVHLR